MVDKKRRMCRLIESYVNDFRGDAVSEMYGKGTKIKIHNLNFANFDKSVLVEAIIVLGDTINEETLDRKLVDYLIQDAMTYIFPDLSTKCMVRWDV